MFRRTFLAGAISAPSVALGFGESNRFHVAELDLGAGTVQRPGAWKRLQYEVAAATSIDTAPLPVVLRPDDLSLFDHPFASLIVTGNFVLPETRVLELLGRYLSYGGFLVLDDASGVSDGPALASIRTLCASVLPGRTLTRMPADHSVFRSFFLLNTPTGRFARHGYLDGVTVGDVSPIVVHHDDLSGALDRGSDGRDSYAVVPGGERQRNEAIKLALNLVVYSVTADYKKDQTHVRQLLLEGRIE